MLPSLPHPPANLKDEHGLLSQNRARHGTRTHLLPLGLPAKDHVPEGEAVHRAVPLRMQAAWSVHPCGYAALGLGLALR